MCHCSHCSSNKTPLTEHPCQPPLANCNCPAVNEKRRSVSAAQSAHALTGRTAHTHTHSGNHNKQAHRSRTLSEEGCYAPTHTSWRQAAAKPHSELLRDGMLHSGIACSCMYVRILCAVTLCWLRKSAHMKPLMTTTPTHKRVGPHSFREMWPDVREYASTQCITLHV